MNIFNCILSHIKKSRIKQDMLADREYEGIPLREEDYAISIDDIHDKLQEGDFLFCRAKEDKEEIDLQSKVIQSVTGGYYTHCGLYIGSGEVLHAVKPCVTKISVNDLLQDYNYLVVTRLNCIGDRQLTDFVNQNINKEYNLKGAIKSPSLEKKYIVYPNQNISNLLSIKNKKNNQKRTIKTELFCSQLLMEYLSYNGCLTERQQKEEYFQSENWTPTGLAKYGYGDFFKLIGFIHDKNEKADFSKDYFLTGNMKN